MKSKTIRITCTGADAMRLRDLVELQGNLKELSVKNYEKLKKLIARDGFAFPFAVATLDGRPYGIIDGHQRHRTVIKMLEDGYTIADATGAPTERLPVVFIACDDKQHASRLILAAVSQFGKLTDEGMYEFMHAWEMEMTALADFDFPDFDSERFVKGYSLEDGCPAESEKTDNPADTVANVGEYRWPLLRDEYLQWKEKLRQQVGFDDSSVIAEIKARLQL